MRAARRPTGGSGLASFLVLVGCVVVLGGTFLLGVAAGRRWPGPPVPGRAAETASAEAPGRRPDKRARAADPAPTLTFYRELTAPLTSPPATPRAPRPAPRAEKASPPERAAAPARGEGGPVASPTAETPPSRYTIQVGAYRERAQADALRQRLATAGHDAYVVDGEGPGGVRYRVRVGTFAAREAAQEAAARLAREQSLTAFVTAR